MYFSRYNTAWLFVVIWIILLTVIFKFSWVFLKVRKLLSRQFYWIESKHFQVLFIYKGTYVIHRDTISVEWVLFEKSTRDIRLTHEDFWLIKGQNYHHIETSQLIYTANQLTGFYMVATLVCWFNLLIKEPECFVAIIVNLEQIIILSWVIVNTFDIDFGCEVWNYCHTS